jgi:hypothetical protein
MQGQLSLTNCTFKTLQMKVFGQKNSKSMQGIKSAKLEITNLALLIPCMEFEFGFFPKYLHLKCFECSISKLFQNCVSVSSKSRI